MSINHFKDEINQVVSRCQGRVGLIIESENCRIEINNHTNFPSASLIKIPILIECFRQSERGILDHQEHISVDSVNRVGGSGVLQALSSDLHLRVADLMTLMITVSDNIATNLLIKRLGMPAINECMKDLNLQSTELNRKMMDFEAVQNGVDNWTSANDMITCLKAINTNSFLSMENAKQALSIMEKQQFMNKLPSLMDTERLLIANKTGELMGVEHDCAIIKYGNQTIYASVLIDQLNNPVDGRQTLAEIGQLVSKFLLSE